jgi:DNA-directed RNA polymerase subunit RPC12/RpoP
VTDRACFLYCSACGKQVSTAFFPVPTETPDRGIIVRAWIACPECVEKEGTAEAAALTTKDAEIASLHEQIQRLRNRGHNYRAPF